MSDTKPTKSELIPNTYPTPNWIIDEGIWALLDNPERACYQVVVRKTLGWLKQSDRIAVSVISDLTGLSPGTIRKAMKRLVSFGLVLRAAENDERNYGVEWKYQPDHNKVDLEALLERGTNRKGVNAKRVAAMRSRLGGVSVGHIDPPSVGQTDPPSVGQEAQNHLSIPPRKPTTSTVATRPPAAKKKKGRKKAVPFTEFPENIKHLGDALVECDANLRPRTWGQAGMLIHGDEDQGRFGLKQYLIEGITPEMLKEAYKHHTQVARLSISPKYPAHSLLAAARTIKNRWGLSTMDEVSDAAEKAVEERRAAKNEIDKLKGKSQ